MAALQLLSLLLLTSPALADPGPGRSADGRRPAAPLPQGRFPAERLVPPGFRGPNVLEKLAAFANEPLPVKATVTSTIAEFKRTHQDNWAAHKQRLTLEQQELLSDLVVAPSFYA